MIIINISTCNHIDTYVSTAISVGIYVHTCSYVYVHCRYLEVYKYTNTQHSQGMYIHMYYGQELRNATRLQFLEIGKELKRMILK
jgi:hypothetical protein